MNKDSEEISTNNEPIPPGYEVLRHVEPPENGKQSPPEIVVVKKKAEPGLSGDIVKGARMGRGNLGEPIIEFELTDAAGKKFGKVTRDNIGRRLAIVLDGQLYSAPQHYSEKTTGARSRAISRRKRRRNSRRCSKTRCARRSTLILPMTWPRRLAGIRLKAVSRRPSRRHFGFAFMLIYYRVAGLTANIALVTNIIILLGVMCSVGTTLTLPGIAGVVLTIGMAVDANVLIYERLREELAKGKSLRGAIAAGYARAFGTIFDSHVTTLISSVILIFMGTGEIKGFGVTLTIGVAASLFTALVVTRLIFDFLLDRNWLKSLGMFHLIRSTSVNFMGAAKPLFIITWAFVILSLGYGFTRGSQLFGVDFLGGDSTTFSFTQRVDWTTFAPRMTGIGEKDVQIQYQKDVIGGTETLRVTTPNHTADKVKQALAEKFPQAKLKRGQPKPSARRWARMSGTRPSSPR